MNLDQLPDHGSLLEVAKVLEQENLRLIQRVLDLQRQVFELQGKGGPTAQERLALLEHQLSQARDKLFGDSSEKRPRDEPSKPRSKPTHKGHGPTEQPALKEISTEHKLDEADQSCPCCGKPLLPWKNQFESSEQIDVIERTIVLRKHLRQKYRCECGHIETALPPPQLQEGGRYSIDFAVEVAVDKYLDHLPLERQVRRLEREALQIESQTLWDQLVALYDLVKPLGARLRIYLHSQPIVGADETWWRLMSNGKPGSEPTKRWWIWALSHPTAVYYSLQPGRGEKDGSLVLRGYSGIVMADGYGVYPALARLPGGYVLVFCWAHARRKFYELRDTFPTESSKILDLIGKLYANERAVPPGELFDQVRLDVRQQLSKPVIKELQQALLELRVLPGSALEKAAQYLANRWTGLTRFLDNPIIPLDNNGTERGLRGPVVGRKNHYGSRSKLGTQVAALFYSLLESAKLNGIDGRAYLRFVAREAAAKRPLLLPHECVDRPELRLDRHRSVEPGVRSVEKPSA